MKKTLIIITSIIMLCVMLVGCQATDMSITTSKELNKNLNLLMNTVNRLDSVDNDYLVSNDVYSLNAIQTSAVPTPNRAYKNVLASNSAIEDIEHEGNITTYELTADEVSLKEDLTEALKNELVNRLYCDEKGNCKICNEPYTCNNNNMCNSCNKTIICDENGNCTNCNKQLILDNQNNCTSCNKSCVSTTPNNNISTTTSDCLKRISSDNEKLKIELLGTKNKDIVIDLNSDVDVNNNSHIDNISYDSDTNTNIDDANKNNINNNQNNHITKDIWGSDRNKWAKNNEFKANTIVKELRDDEKTISVIDDTNTNETNTDIIVKDTVNNDTIVDEDNANSDTNLDNNITNENDNKYKIIYYGENVYFPEHLRYRPRFISQINYEDANSNLNRYVEKLQKLYTMTADVVEANNTLANYKIVILDNIGEAKELNNCVLEGTCTPTNNQILALNNYIEDMKSTIRNLRNLNGNLTNEINKISTNNTGISQSIDVTNSNYLTILNQIDTRISFHENAIATLEQIKYLLQDAQNNQDKEVTVEDLNKNQTVVIEDNYVVNDGTNEDRNIVETNDDTVITNTVDSIDNTIDERAFTSNIDTYKNNDLSNVNSYLDNKNIGNRTDNITNNISNDNAVSNNDLLDNNTNNEIANNTNNVANDSIIENTDNIDDNYLIDNSANNNGEIPQMVDGNNANLNDGIYSNGNYNNNFDNTIISQNNLDNNDFGNNSYRYDSNGTLYNNTNGYNNAGLNNVNEKNNIVNTYKYNTLIDSINRGTINNGINTL